MKIIIKSLLLIVLIALTTQTNKKVETKEKTKNPLAWAAGQLAIGALTTAAKMLIVVSISATLGIPPDFSYCKPDIVEFAGMKRKLRKKEEAGCTVCQISSVKDDVQAFKKLNPQSSVKKIALIPKGSKVFKDELLTKYLSEAAAFANFKKLAKDIFAGIKETAKPCGKKVDVADSSLASNAIDKFTNLVAVEKFLEEQTAAPRTCSA